MSKVYERIKLIVATSIPLADLVSFLLLRPCSKSFWIGVALVFTGLLSSLYCCTTKTEPLLLEVLMILYKHVQKKQKREFLNL